MASDTAFVAESHVEQGLRRRMSRDRALSLTPTQSACVVRLLLSCGALTLVTRVRRLLCDLHRFRRFDLLTGRLLIAGRGFCRQPIENLHHAVQSLSIRLIASLNGHGRDRYDSSGCWLNLRTNCASDRLL